MSPAAQKILEDALALPEEARVHLAAVLLDSVDHEPPDTGVEEAWAAEARKRLDEVHSGKVKPVSWGKAEALIFDSPDGPKAR